MYTTMRYKNRSDGFTLIEVLIAVVILATVAAVSMPGFIAIAEQNRASSAANELLAGLQFARSTAVSRSQPVVICAANLSDPDVEDPTGIGDCRDPDGGDVSWHDGWIVVGPGDEVLRVQSGFHSLVTITGDGQLRFQDTGTLIGPLSNFNVDVGDAGRTVRLAISGNARVATAE